MTKTIEDRDDPPPPESKRTASRDWRKEFEERVHKLEVEVAEIKMSELMQTTVMERSSTLTSAAASGQTYAGSDRVLVLGTTTDNPLTSPPPPPKGAVLHPPESPSESSPRAWFFYQLIVEMRLILHMYFDPRYRISRTTQFVLPALVLLVVLNYFVFSQFLNLVLISPILERLLDLILCVVGYKLLTVELGRYREVLDYLSRYGVH